MHTTLIDADTVAARPDAFRILDCRGRLDDPGFGPRAYADGHLPGALYVSLDDDFAAPPGSGGRHPLPDPERLCERFRAWGVNDDDQIVVYDDAGGAFAARAWWCARWLGHEAVAVLDGGIGAWHAPLSQAHPVVARGNFSIRASLTRAIDVTTLAADPGAHTLIDARAQARYSGAQEPIDPVAGHIPGALCLPFQGNLRDDGRFRSAEELAARFAGLPDDVVCYCGSGVTAAHNVLAMKIAGRPEPMLYPGSWSEWIRDPERPVATGDA
jgi:thiosulfate/3-mercaptopyruvate sulfurtransferase